MNSILVASDLSYRSDRALTRAFLIAAETGARLTVLSVIDEDMHAEIRDKAIRHARARLDSISAAQPKADEVIHVQHVMAGDPLRDIVRAADEAGAELIVLGRHRDRPVLDLFMPTTMEKLARLASVPVLLVHDAPEHGYRRILAPVDFSPASVAALRSAMSAAPHAALHAFHAYSAPFKGFLGGDAPEEGGSHRFRDEACAALGTWRAASRLPERMGEVEIVEGAVGETLGARLAKEKPDLLAIGAHGRAAFSPSLLGRFTEDLIRDAPCDLLVARR